ncbi:M48 family metalloprotease [Coleofasciculus sp. H7-2]|uniref:M48 family metalloprotease n=1 Tax=Coleofasciculus sp. H7-2 TaxID=3351545 RepID=UPI00366B8D9F
MACVPNPSLEAGLAALKQGNYPDAIAHLEGVCEFELSQKTVLRAQMGLVVAYERTGEIEKARSLCQTLTQSKYPKVKDWGERNLANLVNRYPQLQKKPLPSPTSDVTGFIPLDQTPATPPAQGAAPASDVTGFIPLDQTPATPPAQRLSSAQPASERARANSSKPVQKATPSSSPLVQGAFVQGKGKIEAENNLEAAVPTEAAMASDTAADTGVMSETPSETPSEMPIDEKILESKPSSIGWRQAGRAKGWRAMPAVKPERLWLLDCGTAIALSLVIRVLVQFVMTTTNNFLVNLPFLQPISAFYEDPTWPIVTVLVLLACLSPWILDFLLKQFEGMQPLSLSALSKSSPEAAKMLPRYCGQRRLPVPTLRILPISAPVALTYGNLPRTARIVVSQGLLDQLAEDEIATIYASELGHIVQNKLVGLVMATAMFLIGGFFSLLRNSDWAWTCWWIALACLPLGLNLAVMSLVMLVAQIPYILYRQVARWGDRLASPLLKVPAAVVSALSYGLFWLVCFVGLWLSRLRIIYSDRIAADITGNPNAFTRALLKITTGIADVQKHQSTRWLLEGFEMLSPVGYRQAISLGSIPSHTPWESVLQWDYLNPHRQWMVINNSHPLMGDRLYLLCLYARHWKLETELDFTQMSELRIRASSLKTKKSKLLLQGAPFFGILFGLALGCLFWLLGWIGSWLGIQQLAWILDDYWTILVGCLPIGFSIGTFLRINTFFPDIKSSTLQTNPNLSDLSTRIDALPVDSQPVRLQGKLLGRQGISNWLGQDLILQTDTGLVKLHYCSPLGSIGNLLPWSTRPCDFVNRQVTATGWFRRGATPWIDLETLRTQGGITSLSRHPIWSTIVACLAAAWGTYIILFGI